MKKDKSRTLSIEEEGRLSAMKKAMRETTHRIKPMVTTDRKKKENKLECRKKIHTFDAFGRG